MTDGSRLAAPLACILLGWRCAAAERIATLGVLSLYLLLLCVFWELWQATPFAEVGKANIDAPHLLWYMMVTESVAIGVGYPYRAVEADIHSGRIAAGLMRPIPYSWMILAEWIGITLYRVLLLAVCGLAAGIAMTGGFAISPILAPMILFSTALACGIALLCQLQIGYAAAWVGSAAPPFWIWQKLTFVLGGLILPLSLYPQPCRAIAEATPFSAMLFAPGSLVFATSPAYVMATVVWQMFWLIIVGAATDLFNMLLMVAFYPQHPYGFAVRLVLFTVVPTGFISFLPVTAVRDGNPAAALAVFAAAIAYMAIAVFVFECGLRATPPAAGCWSCDE